MGGRKGGIDDGGPAYPVQNWLPTLGADEATRPHWGMSLRDWFAGQAMAALIPNSKANESAIAGAKKFEMIEVSMSLRRLVSASSRRLISSE